MDVWSAFPLPGEVIEHMHGMQYTWLHRDREKQWDDALDELLSDYTTSIGGASLATQLRAPFTVPLSWLVMKPKLAVARLLEASRGNPAFITQIISLILTQPIHDDPAAEMFLGEIVAQLKELNKAAKSEKVSKTPPPVSNVVDYSPILRTYRIPVKLAEARTVIGARTVDAQKLRAYKELIASGRTDADIVSDLKSLDDGN